MLQFCIPLRKKVGELTQRLEERTAQTPSFFVRLYLVIALFVMYMILAIQHAISVLFLSPQRVFETVQSMDPLKGYTVSYSQYRSRHRVAQLSVVSSTLVIVCITMLNGFLFSREQTFAASSETDALPRVQSEAIVSVCPAPAVKNVRVAPIGSDLFVSWSPLENAAFYTVQWQQKENEQADDSSDQIMTNQYLIKELVYGKRYTVTVKAFLEGCDEATQSSVITAKTHARMTAQLNYSKPRIAKAAVRNTQATVSWKPSIAAKSYRLQLANAKGKILKTYRSTKVKKLIIKLRPQTMYQVRVQAIYVNGEESALSAFTSFTTH